MPFSGLETALLSVICALIASGVVALKLHYSMQEKFITRDECALQHQSADRADANVSSALARVSAKQDLQFRMLRVIVLHLELPSDKKEELLNMRAEANQP